MELLLDAKQISQYFGGLSDYCAQKCDSDVISERKKHLRKPSIPAFSF